MFAHIRYKAIFVSWLPGVAGLDVWPQEMPPSVPLLQCLAVANSTSSNGHSMRGIDFCHVFYLSQLAKLARVPLHTETLHIYSGLNSLAYPLSSQSFALPLSISLSWDLIMTFYLIFCNDKRK